MRPPTVSEMFYPGGHNFDGTLHADREQPEPAAGTPGGLDVGVNLRGDDLFTSGDHGFLKVGYFRNRISNYITFATDPRRRDALDQPAGHDRDAGHGTAGRLRHWCRLYQSVALTMAETRQPLAEFAGIGNDVGRLPDDFATLDAGMRFFEQALTLGGRVRYTGDSILAFGTEAHRSSGRPTRWSISMDRAS